MTTIDLYQSHKDDAASPLEATLEAYATLIEQGKVRVIGASNYKGARLTEAIELAEREHLPMYRVLQPEYNLHDRQAYETDLAPVAERFSLGVIPYFSLASGFLTGKYHSLADTEGVARGSRVTGTSTTAVERFWPRSTRSPARPARSRPRSRLPG